MLLYRAPAAKRAPAVPVPASARELVERGNAAVAERRRAEAARRDRLECCVRWDASAAAAPGTQAAVRSAPDGERCQQHEMALSRSQPVGEVASSVLAAVLPLMAAAEPRALLPPSRARVRVWDSSSSVPAMVLPCGGEPGAGAEVSHLRLLGDVVGASSQRLELYVEVAEVRP